uniref:Uncharacterized protein n=1 Tax=Leptobrachium leishanense TaxID=445787 RepID=A0A8C5PD80_9ANUR
MNRSQTTEKILDFTLEIIYLLTGEDYIFMKKNEERVLQSRGLHVSGTFSRTQSPNRCLPRHTLVQERNHDQKILKLTNKIVHLLTGEVWEYLEGQGDLYKDTMIESLQPLSSLDEPVGKNVFDGFQNPISAADRLNENESYVINHLRAGKAVTQKKKCVVEVIEDSLSSEDGLGLPLSLDYQSTPLKEESVPCREDYNADTDVYTSTDPSETEYPSVLIKEEPGSREEELLTDNYIYSPAGQAEFSSSQIKEESAPGEEGNLIGADLYNRSECPFPIGEYSRADPVEERILSIFTCSYCGKRFSRLLDGEATGLLLV